MRLEIPLIGTIDIYIADKSLRQFSKRQLNNYFISDEKEIKYHEYVRIKTNLSYDSCLEKWIDLKGTLSRGLVINEKEICYNDITIRKTSDGFLDMSIRFKGNPWLYLIKFFLQKIKGRHVLYAKLHSSFYEYILFPIFLLFSLKGFFLLHGSLLDKDGSSIVLLGLDGVGKSSLSNLLVSDGAVCYSDNFLLFNGSFAIPFTLAMRLSPGQKTNMCILYSDRNTMEVLHRNNAKEPVEPDLFVLLQISENFFIRQECISLANLVFFLNNAPEISAANSFAGPFGLFGEAESVMVPINILGIPKGKLEKGKEWIKNEVNKVRK